MKLESINLYLSTGAQVILLVNVVLFWFIRRADKSVYRFFWYYLITALVVQIVAKVLWLQSRNNLPLLHLYTLLEFVWLSLFYNELLNSTERGKRHFLYFVGTIGGLIILNSLFWQPLTLFNSNAKTLTHVLYIGYAVSYFFRSQLKEGEGPDPRYHLLNSGLLMYYAASLFIFMFGNVFLQLTRLHRSFWIMNAFFYFGFQLLILYWLWRTIFRSSPST